MEALLFTIGVGLLQAVYGAAAWVNPKARLFREGRIHQAARLRQAFPGNQSQPLVWFHCASLGEFEQARPVIESLKSVRPDVKVLITFFSPSGYEVRKNYQHADYVFYLPWDTVKNAEWFATSIRPAIAVFVKYEFWYHYSRALRSRNIPLISISAIFRPSHIHFKPHGFAFRSILKNFSWFFVQNQESAQLLKSIGIDDASVAGDTRFDRVAAIASQAVSNNVAEAFKGTQKVMVIGSAWPEDMEVLIPFMNESKGALKFIVAPHEIKESFLASIEKSFNGKSIRYSKAIDADVKDASLLLVDSIGLLSQLYRYGNFAFVGGGFKQGLHNILEAACYGIPVFFGGVAPYYKFQEAVDLVSQGGAFAVNNTDALKVAYQGVASNQDAYLQAGTICRTYVQSNRGATEKITDYLLKALSTWKAA